MWISALLLPAVLLEPPPQRWFGSQRPQRATGQGDSGHWDLELFIPSQVLAIRHYLSGGACPDMAQGSYLPRAVDWSFPVHPTDTPALRKCQGWAQQLPSRGIHSPLAGRASSWGAGLSPCSGCVTRAGTKALITAPYFSQQTFCGLAGHVRVTAARCRCWWGCDYGWCFAWKGTDAAFAKGKPKGSSLGSDSELQRVGLWLRLGFAALLRLCACARVGH